MKTFLLLLSIGLFFRLATPVFAEPKAYDLVNYHGKSASLIFSFSFAAGYPEASTFQINDAQGKSTKFKLEELTPMRFVPVKNGGVIQNVALSLNGDDRAPAMLTGSYGTSGKSTSFILRRK